MSTTAERAASGVVRRLGDLSATDAEEAGGKAAHLGELIAAGFPVPDGFVLPADGYRSAMEAAGVRDALAAGHAEAVEAPPAPRWRCPRRRRSLGGVAAGG